MLYAIIAADRPNSVEARKSVRPRHMEYIRPLVEAGRIVLAGPHPAVDIAEPTVEGMTGSLIVAEFESLDAAREWAAHDPYLTDGVFADVQIKPFIQVVP